MKLLALIRFCLLKTVFLIIVILPLQVYATTVRLETTMGNIDINLFDFDVDPNVPNSKDLQATVDNFLAYVNANRYDGSYFHRLSPGFVLQGGGYVYNGTFPEPQPNPPLASTDPEPNLEEVVLTPGQANPTVANQARYSNVRGTIAMAKLGSDPDSATSQWFINLANNAPNLDLQNGGFTVFGRVMGNGMDVVDALAGFNLLSVPATTVADTRYTYNSPLDELPLQNYNSDDFVANLIPTDANLAMITSVMVLDSNPNTETESDLIVNELILGYRTNPYTSNDQYKDGGSIGLFFLNFLSALLFYRRRFQK